MLKNRMMMRWNGVNYGSIFRSPKRKLSFDLAWIQCISGIMAFRQHIASLYQNFWGFLQWKKPYTTILKMNIVDLRVCLCALHFIALFIIIIVHLIHCIVRYLHKYNSGSNNKRAAPSHTTKAVCVKGLQNN